MHVQNLILFVLRIYQHFLLICIDDLYRSNTAVRDCRFNVLFTAVFSVLILMFK